MLHPDQLTIMDFLALVGDQSGRWPYPQWPDPWWSKHREYRSRDIIRELRRECRKAGHYLAIILPKPFSVCAPGAIKGPPVTSHDLLPWKVMGFPAKIDWLPWQRRWTFSLISLHWLVQITPNFHWIFLRVLRTHRCQDLHKSWVEATCPLTL